MPYKQMDIQKVLPDNKVYWKLIFCPKRRATQNEYRMAIELKDKKRQYTCVSFENLCDLIKKIPMDKRCFYEYISQGDAVKFYLDYEYRKTDPNSMIDVKKALLSIQQLFMDVMKTLSADKNISIQHMLLLESSSFEKESYHIILDHKKDSFRE